MSFVTRLEPDGAEEEVTSPILAHFVRPSLCELLGTLFLVFASVVVGTGGDYFGDSAGAGSRGAWVETAVAEGLGTLALTLALGGESGAQLSPAVSLAACLGGGLSPLLLPFYLLAQFFGAFVGALAGRASLRGDAYVLAGGKVNLVDELLSSRTKAVLSGWLVGTMVALSYLMVAVGSGGRQGSRLRAGLGMGAVVGLGTLVLGPLGLNPARSLAASAALSLFSQQPAWDLHYVHHVGPLLGALTAALLYRIILAPNAQRLRFFPDHK